MKNKKIALIISLILLPFISKSQVTYENIKDYEIYEFLDELASLKLIELNSAIKPYSRTFILEQLNNAEKLNEKLNNRQKKELIILKKEYKIEDTNNTTKSKYNIFNKKSLFENSFNPLSISYVDSNFRATIRPIIGRTYSIRDDNEFRYHNQVGISFFGYIGNNLGIYASLRDNYQKNDIYAKPTYLTLYEGGSYKYDEGGRVGADYSEMIGGITYSWKWGSLGLVKDNIEWGDNYHGSNILSGRAPTFATIKLNLKPTKWFELNYIHGWLVSMVKDSSQSYITSNGDSRIVYKNKYIAANMFTIRPFKNFVFSFGNSIIYSDKSIQAAYLIPIMFYKSIDHTINQGIDNENSQMFFNFSSRNIKKIHLYASFFIDEFSFKRIGDPKRTNFISYKGGIKTSNFLINNLSFIGEYTSTMPITFKHRIPSATFESNNYNLGNYLIDNAQEIYLNLTYKPTVFLSFSISYTNILKGNDYPYIYSVNSTTVDEFTYLKDIIWKKESLELNLILKIVNNMNLSFGISKSIIKTKDADGKTELYYLNKYTSPFEQGNHLIINGGLNIGI